MKKSAHSVLAAGELCLEMEESVDRNSILTTDEIERVVRAFLETQPDNRATEGDIQKVVAAVARWKLGAVCFEMVMAGKLVLDLDENGEVVLVDA